MAPSTPLSLRTRRPELSRHSHPLCSRHRCQRVMAGMMRRIQLARWSLFPGVATPTLGTQSATLPLPRLAPQQPHHRFPPACDSGDSMDMCIWGAAFFVAWTWQPGIPWKEGGYVMRILSYGHCDAGIYLHIRTRFCFSCLDFGCGQPDTARLRTRFTFPSCLSHYLLCCVHTCMHARSTDARNLSIPYQRFDVYSPKNTPVLG